MTTAKKTAKKVPAKGAFQGTIAAALAVKPTGDRPAWENEKTRITSVRMPLSLYRRIKQRSDDLKLDRGADKKPREQADLDSIHGLTLIAISEYLDKIGARDPLGK